MEFEDPDLNQTISKIDAEYRQQFSQKDFLEEMRKAEEYDKFFAENAEKAQLDSLLAEQKSKVAQRKKELLIALNFFENGLKSNDLQPDTKFSSLYKFFGNKVASIAKKENGFIDDDYKALFIFKALLELKEDGFKDEADIYLVIEALSDKFESLSNI